MSYLAGRQTLTCYHELSGGDLAGRQTLTCFMSYLVFHELSGGEANTDLFHVLLEES